MNVVIVKFDDVETSETFVFDNRELAERFVFVEMDKKVEAGNLLKTNERNYFRQKILPLGNLKEIKRFFGEFGFSISVVEKEVLFEV